jgi:hypothetical protein
MPFLLDANVLITAKRDYYRFPVFPCYWAWLVSKNADAVVYSIDAVKDEITVGADDLSKWAKGHPGFFQAPDASVTAAAAGVSAWVNDPARPYLPAARAAFFASADYWLVAHALAKGWIVVTHERPDPQSKRRVKIPDVCTGVGAAFVDPFDLLQNEGAELK